MIAKVGIGTVLEIKIPFANLEAASEIPSVSRVTVSKQRGHENIPRQAPFISRSRPAFEEMDWEV